MGRPLKKDVFGTDVIRSFAGAATGITVSYYDGSTTQIDGVIIKQRGANSFVVTRVDDVGDTSSYKVCKLVNSEPNAAGEMQILGYVGGNGVNNRVSIAKITRRIAYGFPSSPDLSNGFYRGEDSNDSDNHDATRYTWYLENDSSADILVLTPITAVL